MAELESLLGAGARPPVPSSSAGADVVEESLPAPGAEYGRLAKTPRSMEAFVESLCQEESRCLRPFGADLETVPLGTRLSGGECYRRLVCFRFDVEYETLPLGGEEAPGVRAGSLQARENCARRARRMVGAGSRGDVAALRRGARPLPRPENGVSSHQGNLR